MPNQRIRGNQITDPRTITQNEHEEKADAKRSILVDENGNAITPANPLPVDASVSVGDIYVDLDGFSTLDPDSTQVVGSLDGTKTGQKYGFVNNLRQMILASHDRVRNVVYLDPTSRKNRRVDKFIYTSSTFPGYSLVRQFNYSLINNEYVFTNDTWSVV
jgi:hypothetical protein